KSGYDGHARWGFKDPRTCITLPVYLEIFPNSQLVHIVRDEADVAASLAARRKKGVGLVSDLSFWNELRRLHIERAREYGSKHKHYYELNYEEFCTRPVEVTNAVLSYLGCQLTRTAEEFLRTSVYTDRIGAAQERNLAD